MLITKFFSRSMKCSSDLVSAWLDLIITSVDVEWISWYKEDVFFDLMTFFELCLEIGTMFIVAPIYAFKNNYINPSISILYKSILIYLKKKN